MEKTGALETLVMLLAVVLTFFVFCSVTFFIYLFFLVFFFFICIFAFVAAVERNNLMRLSQSIPFTPVPPRGEWGENSAGGSDTWPLQNEEVSGQMRTCA